ncbi:uncharacterized protein TA13105 [Theileria annulata]|uniref:Uncharacterized protein n=1 Tax=Theileria annulata TaxID=5874 RepID=Q4UEC9_THEAN|nr:uncharacterized protein TA13105 [Theileria annulata]CAI74560.1 hypothetical protein TA13105 [Theileria annulata]|eukprot:XP_952292.1 hypothetical protein TA13105 [Theileria annulata]
MKFIYRLDSVGSPVFGSSETFEIELEETGSARPDQNSVLDSLMTPLNTQLSEQTNMKPLDTEDLTSASAHYTLEDFFNTYSQHSHSYSNSDIYTNRDSYTNSEVYRNPDTYRTGDSFRNTGVYTNSEVCRKESIEDVCEAGFDFSKLFTMSDESPIENSFQSLIDLVRCEIPSNLSSIDPKFKQPNESAYNTVNTLNQYDTGVDSLKQFGMAEGELKNYDVPVVKAEPSKTRGKSKKKRSNFVKTILKPKPITTSVKSTNGSNLVSNTAVKNGKKRELVNSRRIDYGINDTPENIYDLEWHPGFTRHLGAKGRSALLELVRKVYRQDPEHYKAILQSRNSPSSISSLPFYSIPMLWELAHQFGIFKQALTVYKNHCFSKSKSRHNSMKNANSVSSISTSVSASSVGSSGSGSGSLVGSDSESLDSEVVASVKKLNPSAPMTTMSGRLIKRSKKMLESTDLLDSNDLLTYANIVVTNSNNLVSGGNKATDSLTLKVDLLDTETNTISQLKVKAESETPKRNFRNDLGNSWISSPTNSNLNCSNTLNESPLTSPMKRIPV